MKRHRTVTAQFGGVCAATGRRYGKGTPLVRTPKGYIIAPSTLTDETLGRPEKAAIKREQAKEEEAG